MTKLSKKEGLPRAESRGFTLIELLLVVAIIIIIASLVIVSVSNARIQGRDSKRIADVARIQLALESYKDAKGYYPPNINLVADCWTTVDPGATQCCGGTCTVGLKDAVLNYLSPLPTDPINKNDNKYQVRFSSFGAGVNPTKYWVITRLEDSSNPNKNVGNYCYEVYGGNITSTDPTVNPTGKENGISCT